MGFKLFATRCDFRFLVIQPKSDCICHFAIDFWTLIGTTFNVPNQLKKGYFFGLVSVDCIHEESEIGFSIVCRILRPLQVYIWIIKKIVFEKIYNFDIKFTFKLFKNVYLKKFKIMILNFRFQDYIQVSSKLRIRLY